MNNKNKKSVRLPSHISPISYKLTIKPDLESFTFSGNEIIKINTEKEINKIILHSKDIEIETASIGSKNKKQFASKITYNTEDETVTISFKKKIIGTNEIYLTFKGIINDNLRGFYRNRYILDGKEKYLGVTQFESTDARRAFPCFDEPEHKAIFEVSLIIAEKHSAISNTLPVTTTEHSAGYQIVSFSPTPRMSTYLLAFIVGEFEYIEGKTKGNVQVRVFTTKGKSHQAKFALEVAIKSLEFYNDYFDIPYPLPTLDLIAIPDFEAAAMENWGAVTFRETAILVDKEKTSLFNKQWVALVIAHELAHQWFGNLVTMKWWTDLWLNEGFATYIEYLAVDNLFPTWNIWNQFLIQDHNVALTLDSLSNSHPIEVTVHHPSEISEIFDKISYSKGGAVIRMLAGYIGHEKFRDGLRHYLKKHSYKNTETIDLWESFEKISGKPIKKMMSLWTKETGHPLISISKIKEEFYVTQERFFSSRIYKNEYLNSNRKKHLWPIPLRYESNNEKLNLTLTNKSAPLIGVSIGKINNEEETFARVCYDETTLSKLADEIKKNSLPVKDRLGIIRDLFALAEGGYIKTDVALSFTLNYKDENEYIVWAEIANGLNRIYNLISDKPFIDRYKNYVQSLFSPLAIQMGFEKMDKEKHSDTFLRNLAISQSAFYGNKKIINQAKLIFKDRNINPIKADIRSIIYNIIAQEGKEKEWKLFEKLYKEESLHEEKERFARALTSFRNENLLEKTINFLISSEVRDQDAPYLLAAVWQNKKGQDLTWKFVKNNWNFIIKKYSQVGLLLPRLIIQLSNHTKTKDLKDAQRFFSKNSAPGAERSLEQAYEKIASNVAWIKDDKMIIKKWLEKNY